MKIRGRKEGDFVLVLLTIGLVIFGIAMVFSASYYSAISDYGDPYYYLKREILWTVIGAVAMFGMANVDYHAYRRFATLAAIVAIVLLLAIFTPLGVEINNATRWLKVPGLPFTLMPGEIAKPLLILFTSRWLSRDSKAALSLIRGLFPPAALMAVCFALIIMQPNLSTALTLAVIVVGIMFIAGMKWRYLISLSLLGSGMVALLIFSDISTHWKKRLTSFLDPFADPLDTGYQVVQGLLALGSGGLFGVGIGKSTQKTLYLPEPQNDFILAIIGEEIGFLGCLVLIAVYAILIWRCAKIAVNAKDSFGCLMASGITIMIAVQVVMNIAVVTSSMPATGVALPFVSYGGNALIIFMGCIGVMVNIGRQGTRHAQAAEA